MSTFILSNNGKVGVYGNGDRVYGSGGTEKAIIMNGAENVVVENTVEEIHVANNMAQLTFRVDTNTNEVSVVSGSTVLAKFAPEAAGIKLFTATGMSVIKSVVDTATGEISFTADNGSASATPVALPTNGSALPSDAIDTNAKSDNAGGTTPTPAPTEPTGITVQEYKDHVAAGTLPDSYNLVDEAKSLAGASYAAVTGAKSITLKDDVTDLTSKANADAVKTATGMATNIVVEDSLNNLLGATLPDFGKPTTLLVNKIDSTNISLSDVTIEKAAGAQAELDAFLARTDVAYKKGLEKPGSLNLSTVTIKDTAANIIAAADDATLKTVLADADSITVGDTMKGISSVALSFVDMVNAIAVEDTLANFVAAKPTETLLKTLAGADTTFTATDAPDDNGAVTADIAGLMGFNAVTDAFISFANADVKEINLTSSTALGTVVATGTNVEFNLTATNFFKTDATVNFTASDKADVLTIKSAFGVVNGGAGNDFITIDSTGSAVKIDGGAGADTITLGTATETVVLGTGITSVDNIAKNLDTIKGFSATTPDAANKGDILDFDGFFSDFAVIKNVTVATDKVVGTGFIDNGIAVLNASVSDKAAVANLFSADTATVGSGNDMLLLAKDKDASGSTNVWYVIDANNDGKIAADEIHLVAVLDGVASPENLVTGNFA